MGRDTGRSRERSKSRKKHKRRRSSSPAAALDASRLFKYASLGKTRKLRSLLADAHDAADLVAASRDSRGGTALHAAARHGQLDVVSFLLRRSADASAQDAAGNTPGHLAAMHGHLLVLTELVKAAGIDLDQPNTAGFSIRQIVQQQKQQEPQAEVGAAAAAAGSRSDASSPSDSYNSEGAAAATAALAAAAAAAASSGRGAAAGHRGVGLAQGEQDDWLDKLAYEMSYEDGGGFQGAWGGALAAAHAWEGPGRSPTRMQASRHPSSSRRTASAAYRAAAGGFQSGEDDDEDDSWADRLWQDMQEHKRAAAAASKQRAGVSSPAGLFSAGSSRAEAARERERKTAAAAAESARILKEEQAKDAHWRAAMMRQVQEAALPLRRSTYEERWQQLEAWPAGKPITFQDVPWPCAAPGSQAAAARKQPQQQVLQLDPKHLQTLVLAGAKSATGIKLALRKELMRWHPDKFTARYGARLAAADKDAIQAGVHAVAQHLTALKQQ